MGAFNGAVSSSATAECFFLTSTRRERDVTAAFLSIADAVDDDGGGRPVLLEVRRSSRFAYTAKPQQSQNKKVEICRVFETEGEAFSLDGSSYHTIVIRLASSSCQLFEGSPWFCFRKRDRHIELQYQTLCNDDRIIIKLSRCAHVLVPASRISVYVAFFVTEVVPTAIHITL